MVPEVKIDVGKILVILVGVAAAGGIVWAANKFAGDIKENKIYDAAGTGGYFSSDALAVRLKNALHMDYIFDWNVDEEEVIKVLQEIKNKSQLSTVSKAYRKVANEQLLDALLRVGGSDYVAIENELNRISQS